MGFFVLAVITVKTKAQRQKQKQTRNSIVETLLKYVPNYSMLFGPLFCTKNEKKHNFEEIVFNNFFVFDQKTQ